MTFFTQTRTAEARAILRIAAPLMAAYIAEYAMFATTKLVVGDLGFKHLAAIGLSGSLTFELFTVMMGILSITGVLAAQAEGAGRKADAGHAARQGLITAVLLSIPATFAVYNLDTFFIWTGQEAEVVDLARPYLHTIAFCVLPTLLFTALRDFVAALSRTAPVMAITVAAVGVNWVLAEGLVHGRFGLPEMGAAGAGIATTAVSWGMFLALLAYIWRKPALRGYGLFRAKLRVDPKVMAEIMRLGLPIGALVGAEAGLFSAIAILSGIIGAETLAAHQILMAWIGIPFVIALGMAEGTMVRVAYNTGAGFPRLARLAGITGLMMGSLILLALVVVPVLGAEKITAVFIPTSDPGFAAVAAIAAQLMLIAAVFQVFDGAQAIMSRALRGVKDAWFPLWIGTFGYWVLGIGGGYVLAFPLGWGGAGLWTGLAAGLIVAAVLLTIRFLRLTGRRIAAAKAKPSTPG